MTPSERRLATGVALAWVLATVLVTVIKIVMMLAAHRSVNFVDALVGEWVAVLQALAGVALVMEVFRDAERFRAGRFIAVAVVLYIGLEVVREIVLRATGIHPRTPLLREAIDMQHFFILVVGAGGAAFTARWHERAIASAEQRASAEAALAEARVRMLRTQVQPDLIRKALLDIETVLAVDGRAAEAALLNLSDFLRIALLRARGESWCEEREAEYDRLARVVEEGSR